MIKNAKLVVYKGAPHGMCTTFKDKVNEELLGFITSYIATVGNMRGFDLARG